jgi:hypothetical protein
MNEAIIATLGWSLRSGNHNLRVVFNSMNGARCNTIMPDECMRLQRQMCTSCIALHVYTIKHDVWIHSRDKSCAERATLSMDSVDIHIAEHTTTNIMIVESIWNTDSGNYKVWGDCYRKVWTPEKGFVQQLHCDFRKLQEPSHVFDRLGRNHQARSMCGCSRASRPSE